MGSERLHQFQVQLRLFLRVGDDCNPQDIVDFIGVPPTKVAVKGSTNPKRRLPRSSYVFYNSTAEHWDDPIDVHIENFLRNLQGREAKIIEISDKLQEVKVSVIIECDEDFNLPGTKLNSELVRFCAKLGSPIDFAVYGLERDDDV